MSICLRYRTKGKIEKRKLSHVLYTLKNLPTTSDQFMHKNVHHGFGKPVTIEPIPECYGSARFINFKVFYRGEPLSLIKIDGLIDLV